MITGTIPRKIKKYLPLAHGDEIYGWCDAKTFDADELVAIPYQYASDISLPWIEVRKNGQTMRSINILDVSEIIFEERESHE